MYNRSVSLPSLIINFLLKRNADGVYGKKTSPDTEARQAEAQLGNVNNKMTSTQE